VAPLQSLSPVIRHAFYEKMIGEQTHLMEVMNSGKYFLRDSKGLELRVIGAASISVGALP
jgi:hypothetical protein